MCFLFYLRSSVPNPPRPVPGITQHVDPPGTREWNITTVWTSNWTQPHATCFYTLGDQIATLDNVAATMALHLVVAAANDLRVPNFPNFAVGKGDGENHAFILLLVHNNYSYNSVSIFFTLLNCP